MHRPRQPLVFRSIRAIALGSVLGALGCATGPRPIDEETRAQLRAMQTRQAALEQKVELLEARLAASRSARRAPVAEAGPKATPAAGASYSLPPNLATVHLAPPERKAPPLPTDVGVKEPEADQVAEIFISGPDEGDGPVSPADKSGDLPAFEAAMRSIRTGDVEGGAAALENFADKNKKSDRAAEALFAAGVGRQNSGDCQQAVLDYGRVAEDYPKADQAPDAMQRMATCQLKLKRGSAAREVYAQIVARYPGSNAAKNAEAELRELDRQTKAEARAEEK